MFKESESSPSVFFREGAYLIEHLVSIRIASWSSSLRYSSRQLQREEKIAKFKAAVPTFPLTLCGSVAASAVCESQFTFDVD